MTKKLFAEQKTASVVDFTGTLPPKNVTPAELAKLERRFDDRTVRGKVPVESEIQKWHFLHAPDTRLTDHRPGSRVSSKFGKGESSLESPTAGALLVLLYK